MTLALLTESRAQTARRCLREESLRYVQGIVPVSAVAEPLRFGTLGHHALEAWWLAPAGERLRHALEALERHATPESDRFELAALTELLIGYDVRWGAELYEAIGVEVEFRAPLINPETGAASRTFQRAGKIDVLAKNPEGRTYIIDHKFSGETITPGSPFWSRLRMGGQASMYLRGADSLGHGDVDGFMYDVIGKPGIRPLKATPMESRKYTKEGTLYAKQRDRDETPEEYGVRVREDIVAHPDDYYQRAVVVRLESEMREHDLDLWTLANLLREYHRLELAPKNADACSRYGSLCVYWPACAGEVSIEDPGRYRRLDFLHPELTPEVNA